MSNPAGSASQAVRASEFPYTTAGNCLTDIRPTLAHSVSTPAARPAHLRGMPPSSESGRDPRQVVKLCRGAYLA